jgi:hypothetical protein
MEIFTLDETGDPVTDRTITDVIGEALGRQADVLVVPVGRLGDDFFQLRTGVAGEILQKCVNYQLTLVVLGELPADRSQPFKDLVYESNRGRHAWFLADRAELDRRL